MQLTKLRAAPERQGKVPPCAPAGEMDGGTASQLIPGVGRTVSHQKERTGEMRKLVPVRAVALAFCLAIPVSSTQAQAPKAGAELDDRGLWVGEWTLAGTAKDTPAGPEYGLTWHLHGSRILGGFFVQIDQVWKGNGPAQHALEILSYDPINKIYNSSGFQSDGAAWVATATSDGRRYVENGTTRRPDGSAAKFRGTWTFSADKMTVSATLESEQDGVWWTSLAVKGTKSPGKTQ